MRSNEKLVDLHRHMDGNLRLQTIIDIAKRCNLELPAWEIEELRPFAQVLGQENDLIGFLKKFDLIQSVIADYQAVRQIARDNVEDAFRENIDYVELRFSPFFMAQKFGLNVDKIVETVCDEVAAAQKVFPVRVKLIIIMCRNLGLDNCHKELAAAIKFQEHGIVGVDLAGDEYNFPGDLFVEHFRLAKAAGLRITVHAGEAAGAESVKQAVEELGAERIGHGINVRHDGEVMQLLIDKGISLEICPTSNVQTNTVPSFEAHPMRQLYDAGINITLNTDDPGVSGIDLAHEYRVAKERLGFSAAELLEIQANGVKAAFTKLI